MTIKEAHEYLNIGKTKFYALIKEGKIKPVKIGKRTLVDPEDLRKFIEWLKLERDNEN